MPCQGTWTLSGRLWRATKDRCAGEQPDYIWALGKITGDHVRDGVGGGEMTGHIGGIYYISENGPSTDSGLEQKLQQTF